MIKVFFVDHYCGDNLEHVDCFVWPDNKTEQEVKELLEEAKKNYLNAVYIEIPELPPKPLYYIAEAKTTDYDHLTVGEIKNQWNDWWKIHNKRKEIMNNNPITFRDHAVKLGLEVFNESDSNDNQFMLNWNVESEFNFKLY